VVKKTINALACALIAPLAFAQTSTTTTEQKTTTQPKTTTETASGAVTTTYEPGKIIVVGSESSHDTFSCFNASSAEFEFARGAAPSLRHRLARSPDPTGAPSQPK